MCFTSRALNLFHSWATWEIIYEGAISRPNTKSVERVWGYRIMQKRECAACKRVQLRTIETMSLSGGIPMLKQESE